MNYRPTIGIECHVQLNTKTKLFAAVSNDAREAEPNMLTSPICFGLPGTLPVLNEKAVELAIRAGLALNAEIAERMKFDRKLYFYPDLPKGYQITQFDEPIIKNGWVEARRSDGSTFRVHIERAHMEEDAGKNLHPAGGDYTLVDLNRAGTPLIEIVSKPDIHSAEEAKAYARELYLLMKYASVSDVDLYHGNMRFDVNISVAPEDSKTLGTRSEIKNLNSFRSIERSVDYEIKRQIELLERGGEVVQETRGWDEAKQKTVPQRSKEEAHDYRYFPEPDIPPVVISRQQVESIKKDLPKLPHEIRRDLSNLYIKDDQIETLLAYPELVSLVEEVATDNKAAGQLAAKLIINVWLSETEESHAELLVGKTQLIKLHELLDSGELSSTNAKALFLALQKAGADKDVHELAKEANLIQVSDQSTLESLVSQVLTDNPQAFQDVKNGEAKAIGFLTGQVMKASRGQANPQLVQKIIKEQVKP